MKVSFNGKWYDPDTEEDRLRDAIGRRSDLLVHQLIEERVGQQPPYSMDRVRGALVELLNGATMIATKLGATAAMHHAYSQPVDHELVDVFAHSLNKLVGLNYVPPERVFATSIEEIPSGSENEEAEEVPGPDEERPAERGPCLEGAD